MTFQRSSKAQAVFGVLLIYAAVALVHHLQSDQVKLDVLIPFISISLAAVLAVLSAIDLASYRLPDALTLPLLASGFLLSMMLAEPPLIERLAAAAIGYVALACFAHLYARIRGKPGLGLGDAKLFAASGSWLGISNLPLVLLIASVSALLLVGLRALRDGLPNVEAPLAFGPFLAFGFWIVWIISP